MRLSNLLQSICQIPAQVDRDISGLSIDSRKVTQGDLFFAIKGTQLDGRHYIVDAIAQGAAAILIEDHPNGSVAWQQNVPLIAIPDLSNRLAELAAHFYDYPAHQLRMVGVTGTSGKTSCTHFIAQILQSLHIECGLMGTLGNGFYGALNETSLTTPDVFTLQFFLRSFLEQQAKAVAMEVSSHSIDQGRIKGLAFEVGVFTNLSQDHLDYHGDMTTYANVKRRFFAEWPMQHAVFNADDDYGRRWARELAGKKSIFAYSRQSSLSIDCPLIHCKKVIAQATHITAHVSTPWGEDELFLPLVGAFNLSNALAVLTTLCAMNVPFQAVLAQLAQLKAVPGRMQMLGGHGKPTVVIDYAHKPDALENVLKTLRAQTKGKLICVFGCGGDRDQGKRPLMAKIAEQWSDRVIITNDNPRHEDPEVIAADIMRGFADPQKVVVELDRSKAIQNSIQWAKSEDCVLIAGKGAERYQQIGDKKIVFDDVDYAGRYLGEQKCYCG